jgi:hypothetical protein
MLTTNERVEAAGKLAAIDEARKLAGMDTMNEELLDMMPLVNLTFTKAACAISCYDWAKGIEELETVAALGYSEFERGLAKLVAQAVERMWDEAGNRLIAGENSSEAQIAIQHGRLDLFLDLTAPYPTAVIHV